MIQPAPTTISRFANRPLSDGKRAVTLHPTHPAARDGRTLFPGRVIHAGDTDRVLKSGHNQRKIGAVIRKGAWSGMPVYTLTLEERATCPRTCHHWLSCYGNGMPWPHRHRAGPELEASIAHDLVQLAAEHDRFAVRLHILGDFYALRYVALWGDWLHAHPGLHVWGYTAWRQSTPLGLAIAALGKRFPDRWFIRVSRRRAIGTGIEAVGEESPGAIVCPAQTGRTQNCGTCALCWSTRRPIVFHDHGRKSA